MLAFHGTPGSRTMIRVIDREARAWRVRVIAPDRPGFGLSTFQRDRRLLDWPDDVEALADHLRLERFVAAGVSGGGPYALACGYKLAGRVTRVGVVSSMGPVVESGLKAPLLHTPMASLVLLQHTPRLVRAVSASVAFGVRRFPDKVFDSLLMVSSRRDREVLGRPQVRAALLEAFREAFRSGVEGTAHEIVLFGREWGFDLREVQVPVHLWHGESDGQVPVQLARFMAQRLPRCQARFIPEAGHYWIFDHQTDLLRALFPPAGR